MNHDKRYDIFKFKTGRLKKSDWNLDVSYRKAFDLDEIVTLFDSQLFRHIENIINKKLTKKTSMQYVVAIEIENKGHYARAVSKKGIKINGKLFKMFLGTAGGLKSNTLLYISDDIIDEVNNRCECGRDKSVPLVPAKYEAYKALNCSASTPIPDPKGILVVSDCLTTFTEDIISIKDGSIEPIVELIENQLLENNVSDGFNLCTKEYMDRVADALNLDYFPSGVCLRNAWLKGMMFAFPIIEFFNEYGNGDYIVNDIWGNKHDIRDIDLILTESSLKLWKCYNSIEHYINCYHKYGFTFSVTKVSPDVLEDIRAVNYQYLQSYELHDSDIAELCKPTVDWIKGSLTGNYEDTLHFLGIDENTKNVDYTQALYYDRRMLYDPYVVDKVNKLIKKKINDAKIGKLLIKGNYQIGSGDCFALMQHICGLEVTGLLKSGEIYSRYWDCKGIDDVVVFRSPMTSHNNIRKMKISHSNECRKWFRYMDNIMVVNGFDAFCQAENGADFDGDTFYSTNNRVLLENYKPLPAICCEQKASEKVIVTDKHIKESNKNGMGNQVGQITNRATAMIDLLPHFDKDSEEYKQLSYRIICGQHYQQNELD